MTPGGGLKPAGFKSGGGSKIGGVKTPPPAVFTAHP